MDFQDKVEISSLSPVSTKYARPEMPPPPYFEPHFISPSSFKAGVDQKLDRPLASLFRLTFRFLQFGFALAAGISYAIELSHGNISPPTNFIYCEVVFGITLLVLIVDSTTARTYRFTWMIEWVLVVLWFVCFAVFYEMYLAGAVEQRDQGVDQGRMQRAVWCDLISALLWLGSAMFSSMMCCTGVKAVAKNTLENMRYGRGKKQVNVQKMEDMERGLIGTAPT